VNSVLGKCKACSWKKVAILDQKTTKDNGIYRKAYLVEKGWEEEAQLNN